MRNSHFHTEVQSYYNPKGTSYKFDRNCRPLVDEEICLDAHIFLILNTPTVKADDH